MFYYQDSVLDHLSIHHIGNKAKEEFYALSEVPVDLSSDEILPDLLMQYFMKPFSKSKEVYRFYHPNDDLELNEAYHFIKGFFSGKLSFQKFSEQIAKHLYESSNHPNIKAGEVYVVALKNVQMEGEERDAVGIFKSENKETYLKVYPEKGGFAMAYEQEAININKLDKGVIVIRDEEEEGYKVLVTDQTNGTEAVYWKDDFLKLKVRNDDYQQTGNYLKVCKNFVQEKMGEVFEIDSTDKIDLLNRSMNFFKQNESFDEGKFTEEVFGNDQAISMFKEYKGQAEEEFDTPFQANFGIANAAVKKMAASYKSVLKLDKNFHVYIHGKRDYIERGYDDERGLNYYKIYFEQEQ